MNARCTVEWKYSHTFTVVGGLGTSQDGVARAGNLVCGDGTGAGQVNQCWHTKLSLAGLASQTLDLAGVLQVAWLETITLVKVKAFLVQNLGNPADDEPDPADTIRVKAAAADGWDSLFSTGGIVVRGGGMNLTVVQKSDTTGYVVTAGSKDDLTIQNLSADPVDVVIAFAGVGS